MAKKPSEERDPKESVTTNQSKGNKSRTESDADLGAQAKETVEKVYRYARSMPRETVTYIALVVGIILIPWQPLWGGAILGVVFGIYFSNELLPRVKSFRAYLESEGQAKSIVLGVAILALLFLAPGVVLGALAAIGVLALLARSQG